MDISKKPSLVSMKELPISVESSEKPVSDLLKFVKDSGVYAISSVVTPFISLSLAPFLTHSLSTSDYGLLTLLHTLISLSAGVTQLGMGAAFFRAYNYDYSTRSEKRSVVSTVIALLILTSVLTVIGTIFMAPFCASHLLGHASHSKLIMIAGGIICVQNLTIPGFSWLRSESRALYYSVLSISHMLITLLANIVLVGFLHRGIEGSLLATGIGYSCIVLCTLPIIIFRVGIRVRIDVARNLLSFGIPLILNVVSYWALQLSDRYLLSRLSSLTETAKYAVAYTLGTVITVIIMGPFTLAWPKAMFSIARRKDAVHIYQLVFRWFSLLLLFSAFCFSSIGIFILHWFFPVAYSSVAMVIPVVSASIVFYGVYHFFMIGANIKRKTWISGVLVAFAAGVNFSINLLLIPHYGAIGAALSTLIAYIVLSLSAYIMNQKIYPITFEVERFLLALLAGVLLYLCSSWLAQRQGTCIALGIYSGSLVLYSIILLRIGSYAAKKYRVRDEMGKLKISRYYQMNSALDDSYEADGIKAQAQIVMHIRGIVRNDMRVLREATALVQAGFNVSIVDIERAYTCPEKEDRSGIHIHHLFHKPSFIHTPFKIRLLFYSIYQLLTMSADAYHAHDLSALPACYIAALLRNKALIFDAHELPMSNMSAHWRRFRLLLTCLLVHIVPRCTGVITVSPHIGQALHTRYRSPQVSLVRNFPEYQAVAASNRIRQHLELGPEAKIVLYQGNIQADRSLEKLVLAARFLKPDTVIVMMGWADDAIRKQLEDLIQHEGMEKQVKLLPPVPYEDLLHWTTSADLGLVLFSPDYSLGIRWCLPNKLFEYIMAGLPILASPLDAVEDVLRQYDVGKIVSSLAPAEIGIAIEAMLADPTALARMHANALTASRQDLCWEKEQHQVIKLYRSVFASYEVI
jgi:O-antigen/teichoic acid export membrane protein/glycosyltransferase involved in cell wall biosynthesis